MQDVDPDSLAGPTSPSPPARAAPARTPAAPPGGVEVRGIQGREHGVGDPTGTASSGGIPDGGRVGGGTGAEQARRRLPRVTGPAEPAVTTIDQPENDITCVAQS